MISAIHLVLDVSRTVPGPPDALRTHPDDSGTFWNLSRTSPFRHAVRKSSNRSGTLYPSPLPIPHAPLRSMTFLPFHPSLLSYPLCSVAFLRLRPYALAFRTRSVTHSVFRLRSGGCTLCSISTSYCGSSTASGISTTLPISSTTSPRIPYSPP